MWYNMYLNKEGAMQQKIPVSEARAKLSRLLKELERNPDAVFEITVNGLVLGELRAAKASRFQIKPGNVLLEAAESMGDPEDSVPISDSVAREHDEYLYSKGC